MLKYRHTTIEDLPQIEQWIAADPAHAGVMKGSDFVLLSDPETDELPKGRQCITVEDDEGQIFYIHLKQALILEIQFPPEDDSRKQKTRVARALEEAVNYFCFAGKKLGHYAMFYESVSNALIQFGEKYLHFRKAENFQKRDL